MNDDFKINALVYKEDENMKIFISEEFHFVFDKITQAVMSWGKEKTDTPTYNPIGPEVMNLLIDNDFEFINYKDFFEKIVNKQEKDGKLSLISTTTNFNFYINDLNSKCLNSLKYFVKYLDFYHSYITLCFKYNDELSLKEITRIKTIGIKNVILLVNDFEIDKLNQFIKLCVSKEIFVSCKFIITKNNYDNFINLLDKFPIDTFSTYKFEKPKTTKQQIKDLNNKINELKTNIFLENEDGSLFSCCVDFEKKLIYPTFNDKKHGIDFDKINNISDFWNSEKFVEVRNSLIDSKYEKEN